MGQSVRIYKVQAMNDKPLMMTNHESNIFNILHRFSAGIRNQYETMQDIVKYFNSPCTCLSEETTGWTEFANCNICGRIVETDKDVDMTAIAADMADRYSHKLDIEYREKSEEDYFMGAISMYKLLKRKGKE